MKELHRIPGASAELTQLEKVEAEEHRVAKRKWLRKWELRQPREAGPSRPRRRARTRGGHGRGSLHPTDLS